MVAYIAYLRYPFPQLSLHNYFTWQDEPWLNAASAGLLE
jgi:hypothetical protein